MATKHEHICLSNHINPKTSAGSRTFERGMIKVCDEARAEALIYWAFLKKAKSPSAAQWSTRFDYYDRSRQTK